MGSCVSLLSSGLADFAPLCSAPVPENVVPNSKPNVTPP